MEQDDDILLIAEQAAAINDILTLICVHLQASDPRTAAAIADSLDAILQEPNIQPAQAFQRLAPRYAKALRGDPDVPLLSLQKRDPDQSGLSALRDLLRRL